MKNVHEQHKILDWVMYNVKGYLNPRWRLVTIDLCLKSCMCCVLETGLTKSFAADLSLQIFNNHYISRYAVIRNSSRQVGDLFSGCGCQWKKFSHIGTCIRRNFTP